MPTYLAVPPAFHVRMEFMNALEKAQIDFSREPEGYLIFLREGQQEVWRRIRDQFQVVISEEDPPMLSGM